MRKGSSVDTHTLIWNKIEVDNTTKCWNWTGAISHKGGGVPLQNVTRLNGSKQNVSVKRLLWAEVNELPEFKFELWNTCGNSKCVNPDHQITNTPVNRFWLQTEIPKDKEDGCWIWVGTLNHHGYGNFRGFNGKNDKAHRFSYRLHYGKFDESLEILHSCDNPACVNPKHLSVGTHDTNMEQMVERGRSIPMRGENAFNNKLTEEQVLEIRSRYSNGNGTYKSLSGEFGVSVGHIKNLVIGKSWAWLGRMTDDK